MTRLIKNTQQPMAQPWPEDMEVRGGGQGLVFTYSGQNYVTAYVETETGNTFLRGEGETIEAAEAACWAKYVVWRDCPHDQGYERGAYRNGAAFCLACGTWLARVLPPLPEDPDSELSLLGRALAGDAEAALEVLAEKERVTRVDEDSET